MAREIARRGARPPVRARQPGQRRDEDQVREERERDQRRQAPAQVEVEAGDVREAGQDERQHPASVETLEEEQEPRDEEQRRRDVAEFLAAEVDGGARDGEKQRRRDGHPCSEQAANERIERKENQRAGDGRERPQPGEPRAEDLHPQRDAPVVEVGLAEPARPERRDLRVPQQLQGIEADLAFVAVHAGRPVAEPVNPHGEAEEEDQETEDKVQARPAGPGGVGPRLRRLPVSPAAGCRDREEDQAREPRRSGQEGVVIAAAKRVNGEHVDRDREEDRAVVALRRPLPPPRGFFRLDRREIPVSVRPGPARREAGGPRSRNRRVPFGLVERLVSRACPRIARKQASPPRTTGRNLRKRSAARRGRRSEALSGTGVLL